MSCTNTIDTQARYSHWKFRFNQEVPSVRSLVAADTPLDGHRCPGHRGFHTYSKATIFFFRYSSSSPRSVYLFLHEYQLISVHAVFVPYTSCILAIRAICKPPQIYFFFTQISTIILLTFVVSVWTYWSFEKICQYIAWTGISRNVGSFS